ncbi:MAG: photosystem I reaction center protein subunit XI [Cyanobacteriota bacterium]|nr:photosystem I reaction center protein subunit XI [Cyanobacteriota bacterium]
MPEAIDTGFVQPYKGDPFVGHLSTPISDSDFTRAFIGNLPIYRKGLSPILRGLEVGMAHGYFLAGPWTKFGPLRDSATANLGGLIPAIALILIATICLSAYGIVSFQKNDGLSPEGPNSLKSAEGWSQFTGGFFIGAMGGAVVAFFLLENFEVVDSIFRGLVNN